MYLPKPRVDKHAARSLHDVKINFFRRFQIWTIRPWATPLTKAKIYEFTNFNFFLYIYNSKLGDGDDKELWDMYLNVRYYFN